MPIHRTCATIKECVAVELQEASHSHERGAILIAALYEVSRAVLAVMGPPRKSDEYLQKQEAALDVISFLAIHLVREHERRGVAVLSELSEGCADPLLKKKLTIYAQELLAKSDPGRARKRNFDVPRALFDTGMVLFIATLLYHTWPTLRPAPAVRAVATAAAPDASSPSAQLPVAAAAAPAAGGGAVEDNQGQERGEAVRPQVTVEKPAQGEQITRIRVSNSQVLVPVLLKHGGEAVRVELVLDTGATRSAIRDGLAPRLRLDLRGAKQSLAELADGRVVPSRVARIDSLHVGPFALAPAEVEIIPCKGSDGMHDGLLGMDFLSKRRYQIDMEREIIRWN